MTCRWSVAMAQIAREFTQRSTRLQAAAHSTSHHRKHSLFPESGQNRTLGHTSSALLLTLCRLHLPQSKMGLFLSRKARPVDGPAAAFVAPAPETVCTKQDHKIWQSTVENLEKEVSETTDERLRENQQACLDWLKTYGLPIPKHEIWAFDGIVRCQKSADGVKIRASMPEFSQRHKECYAIVSVSSPIDNISSTCLLSSHLGSSYIYGLLAATIRG